MAAETAITCDVCGIKKQESNHWILARDQYSRRVVRFYPWDQRAALSPDTKHLCGEGCATKHLLKAIATWSAHNEQVAS